jgi:ABC-type transporter lipoprotein component MlaA
VRTQLLALDPVIERSFDPYAFIRNSWLQRREFQVRDGDVPEENLEEGLDLEDELPEEQLPEDEAVDETAPDESPQASEPEKPPQ